MAALMKQHGITGIGQLRKTMADAGFKVGTGAIVKATKGAAGIRVGTLGKFAQFFDVTVDQMLQPDLGRAAESEGADFRGPLRKGEVFEKLTQQEEAMLQNYRRLLDKDRKAVDAEVAAKAEERQQEADELFARFGVASAVERNARRAGSARTEAPTGDRLKQRELPLDDEGGKTDGDSGVP